MFPQWHLPWINMRAISRYPSIGGSISIVMQ
jgi:hypothetical protein